MNKTSVKNKQTKQQFFKPQQVWQAADVRPEPVNIVFSNKTANEAGLMTQEQAGSPQVQGCCTPALHQVPQQQNLGRMGGYYRKSHIFTLGFWYCTLGLMWHWSRAKDWHLPLDSSLDLGAHFVVEAGFLNSHPPFPQLCHYKTNDVLLLVIKSLHILELIAQLKLGMRATSRLIVAVSLVNIKHTRCLI